MKIYSFAYFLALLLGLISGTPVLAGDVVVIVNKSNPHTVDKAFVTKVFLGKIGEWPDGTAIEAYDQAEDNPLHDKFYSELLGKSPALVKALWAQNIFSGKRLPPKIANPDTLMKQWVISNKKAIGYISTSSLDNTVRVVLQ